MQLALQALLEEKDALESRPDHDHSSIFDRLPVEVMSIIFAFYASKLVRKTSPFTLGAVSKRWREIAWTTPEIWTDLLLYKPRTRKMATCIQLAKDWLSRSGALPLFISVHISSADGELQLDQLISLVDTLNQHCHHWYSLDLDLPPEALCRLDVSASMSPTVYRLALAPDSDGEFRIPGLSRLKPRVVEIHCIQLTHDSLDWSNLTSCTIAHLQVDRILEIFRAAPHLSQCRFEYVKKLDTSLGTEEIDHVTSSRLDSLVVEFSCGEAASDFLDNVTLPALTDLGIHGDRCELHHEPLISFLNRSSCGLKTLSVQEPDYSDQGLVNILRSTPSLEELFIRDGFVDEAEVDLHRAFIDHLPTEETPVPVSTQPLLPLLRTFVWAGQGPYPWSLLKNFLVPLSKGSRRRRPLTSIDIQCSRNEDEPIPYIGQDIITEISKYTDEVEFALYIEEKDGHFVDLLALSLERLESQSR